MARTKRLLQKKEQGARRRLAPKRALRVSAPTTGGIQETPKMFDRCTFSLFGSFKRGTHKEIKEIIEGLKYPIYFYFICLNCNNHFQRKN